MKTISIFSISIAVVLTLLGYAFKIMHWPLASQGITAGLCLLVFGIVALIFSLAKKQNS